MTNSFKLILFPVGGVSGGILALALKQGQLLPEAFDGRWIALGFALGGLVLGHYIDNKRECARIARELEQERIEAPNAKIALGRLLISQSGATRFSSIYSVVVTALCWGLALLILLTRLRDELSYLPHILIAIGALSLLKILWRGIDLIACYEHGMIVRKFLKSRTIMHSDIAGVEFLAVAKYRSGIYEGTTSHFEIIPRVENPVKVQIWGSKRDGQRIARIVQQILTANPDAQLLKIRGVDNFI
jgi:hypothetical protein